MASTYRPYDYDYDTPYTGRTGVIENYLGKKLSSITVNKGEIKDAVKESLRDIDHKFCSIHEHIDCAKHQIIDNVGGGGGCCTHGLATKEDVMHAVNHINGNTNHKLGIIADKLFDEKDFLSQFTDLNEQMAGFNKR